MVTDGLGTRILSDYMLVGGFNLSTPLKNMSSSAGMMTFPINLIYIYIWKIIAMFQSPPTRSTMGHHGISWDDSPVPASSKIEAVPSAALAIKT